MYASLKHTYLGTFLFSLLLKRVRSFSAVMKTQAFCYKCITVESTKVLNSFVKLLCIKVVVGLENSSDKYIIEKRVFFLFERWTYQLFAGLVVATLKILLRLFNQFTLFASEPPAESLRSNWTSFHLMTAYVFLTINITAVLFMLRGFQHLNTLQALL